MELNEAKSILEETRHNLKAFNEKMNGKDKNQAKAKSSIEKQIEALGVAIEVMKEK